MKQLIVSALLVVLGCSPSLAEESEQYNTCTKKADTQLAMHACANEEALRVDGELNDVYQRALAAIASQPAAVEKLRAAERAWIAYRDAYIDAMFPAKNKQAAYGSILPAQIDLLRARLTRQQTQALKELLKQYSSKQ
jgi:uncharacterized protein YecT (DUF1311 family)